MNDATLIPAKRVPHDRFAELLAEFYLREQLRHWGMYRVMLAGSPPIDGEWTVHLEQPLAAYDFLQAFTAPRVTGRVWLGFLTHPDRIVLGWRFQGQEAHDGYPPVVRWEKPEGEI